MITSLHRLPRFIASMVVLFVAGAAQADGIRYDNHKLVEVALKTQADMEKMLAISEDHWSDALGLGVIPFHVEPERMNDLEQSGLEYRVLHENLQALIDAERSGSDPRGGWFLDYHPYVDVNAYMTTLETERPDLAQGFTVGQSLENRTIYGIRITGAGGTAGKPGVLFSGCQHAREWLAVSTPMYFADQFIHLYYTDPAVRNLLDRTVIYVIPIVNPDGYAYTWDSTRLWRKNRRNNGDGSFGVDLNRNWSTGWGLNSGSSGSGTSETYRGTAAFSEPETQVVRNFVLAHPEFEAHIDFHTYSQLILWPWGYQGGQPADPAGAVLGDIGFRMQTAIAGAHGRTYTAGPAGDTLYLASGIFPDWSFAERGMWSYTIELRPNSGTPNGFVQPASEILPTGEEGFAAAKTLIAYIVLPITIQFPNGLPSTLIADQANSIDVNIAGGTDTPDPSTARLYYRVGPAGLFEQSPLLPVGGTTYRGTIPAITCNQYVYYYFEVQSTGGATVRSPDDAPTTLYAARTVQYVAVFSDDMETDQGWTVGAAGDNATRGIWNRMNPQGTTAQPEDDHTAAGTICWVTDGNAGSSAGANDVDGGQTTLNSPVLNLAGASDPVISYWRWYSNSAGGDPNNDIFTVSLSVDGTTWIPVETVGPAGPETSGGWFYHEVRVIDYAAPRATTRVRFVASDTGTGSLVEAAVDDLLVADTGCSEPPPCPGDVNGDDIRDLNDLTLLLASFGFLSGDPAYNSGADFNQDGAVDLADLTVLLSNFGFGCLP
ncbi:MAG: hypothetical protein HZB38_19580 [Planctomycetes bacterium]|nr:hypothetical protein [Planctomycetota bacterium]